MTKKLMEVNKVIQGDCLIKLKELEDNSIDSIVTDPPAGISFMGKSWDTDKGGRDNWIKWMCDVATECKRVLKPGGHAFVWAIPRTSHWTATAWENAGFEIRDVVAHVFGSGFPKSHNIGKNIEKIKVGGIKNLKQVGTKKGIKVETGTQGFSYSKEYVAGKSMGGKQISGDIPVYEINNEYEGWGTALKPAREDWILMRKPLEKGLSIAENCLKYGTGGINIDESRVEAQGEIMSRPFNDINEENVWNSGNSGYKKRGNPNCVSDQLGRFPANLVHDNSEEVRECFPETKPTKPHGGDGGKLDTQEMGWGFKRMPCDLSDNGGNASRYFKSILYYPKASKSERNKGCEELPIKSAGGLQGRADGSLGGEPVTAHNNHPTVKPIALMEYLIKMITPKGGIVLDPFAGSGSTLVAAKQNGFQYIGIELTEEYIPIIEARLNSPTQDKLL